MITKWNAIYCAMAVVQHQQWRQTIMANAWDHIEVSPYVHLSQCQLPYLPALGIPVHNITVYAGHQTCQCMIYASNELLSGLLNMQCTIQNNKMDAWYCYHTWAVVVSVRVSRHQSTDRATVWYTVIQSVKKPVRRWYIVCRHRFKTKSGATAVLGAVVQW